MFFVIAERKKGKLPSMQRISKRNWKLCLQKFKQNMKSMKVKLSFFQNIYKEQKNILMFSEKAKEIVQNSGDQEEEMGFWVVFFVVVFVLCCFRFLLPVCQDLLVQNGFVLICMALQLSRKHLLNILVGRSLKNYP